MDKSELKDITYIGDGVYAGHDGYQIWTFTSNGITDDNFTAFEPMAVDTLYRYKNKLLEQQTKDEK